MARHLTTIVATGGPCSGKSSLSALRQRLEAHGLHVLIVPEIATELFMSGVKVGNGRLTTFQLQEHILRMQIAKEDIYRDIALADPTPQKVLIFERGILDSDAYLEPMQFEEIISGMGHSLVEMRDARYDGVFHLVTAAIGAEEHYTTANNPTRKETPEEAIMRDIRTRNAWIGHPHLRIIDNSTPFKEKIDRLAFAIERLIGIPESLEIEKKYLVQRPDTDKLVREFGAVPILIEQAYVANDSGERVRIRKRGQDGSFVYYATFKQRMGNGVAREEEERIPQKTYDFELAHNRDMAYEIVRKIRYCFLWEHQYFELDVFRNPESARNTTLMEIELEEIDQNVILPTFIDVIEDVTTDYRYANSSIAKGSLI